MLPKGYRNGSRNKDLARKEAARYLEYKPLCEVNPSFTKKRAVIITEVFDTPKPKEDRRGKDGRYANCLKSIIAQAVKDIPFRGTKTEFFDSCGVYDEYKKEKIKMHLFEPNKGISFSPWRINKTMQPGEVKYCQVINYKERNSFENALDSLSNEEIITWNKYTIFAPKIEVEDFVTSIRRVKTHKEYQEDCDKRYEEIERLSKIKNCVLVPEIFKEGLYITEEQYQIWHTEYFINQQKLPDEKALDSQEKMYENYQTFLRQVTAQGYTADDLLKGPNQNYCLPDKIPSKYEIFTDWTYCRKYNELDKALKGRLLGWEQVRKEISIDMIDITRASMYLDAYDVELPRRLACEYNCFMDEHMAKIFIYYPKNYTKDFRGILEGGDKRKFPLNTSKSALRLHQELMELYHHD